MHRRPLIVTLVFAMVLVGACNSAGPDDAPIDGDESAAPVGDPRGGEPPGYTEPPQVAPTEPPEPDPDVRAAAITFICAQAAEFGAVGTYGAAKETTIRLHYMANEESDFARIAESMDLESCGDARTSELAIEVLGYAGLGPLLDTFIVTWDEGSCADGEDFGGVVELQDRFDLGERRVDLVWQYKSEDDGTIVSGFVNVDVAPDESVGWSSRVLDAPVAGSCNAWIRAVY